MGLTESHGVLPGEEGGPGRATNGLRVELVENDAVVAQGVDVGRRNLAGAVKAKVVPSLGRDSAN